MGCFFQLSFPVSWRSRARSIVHVTFCQSLAPRRRPRMTQRVAVDSMTSISWPWDWTMARRVIARAAACPEMTSKDRSAAMGCKPTSTPARIAAAASTGLPRNAAGTNDVCTSRSAIWNAADADSAHSPSRRTASDW